MTATDATNPGTTIEADVAIIGAGPAGTATAVALGQLGVRGVVLTDKHGFPRDKTCGSGVSPKGIKVLRALGVWPEVERAAVPIRGLRLVTPGGQDVYLSAGDELEAIICKRRVLDHLLLERAESLGVTFVPECTASELIEEDGRVAGFRTREGHTVRARYTVVAGGAHCTLTTKERPKRTRLVQAIMGWWDNVPHRPDYVEMIFDRMVSPYYGWLFPESADRVNIGITYEDVEHAIKVLGAQEIERKNAGLVRPVAFEVDDTNLYQRIKDVEAQSVAWSERGRALRAELARRDVSIELPAAGVSIPWSIELGGREDRIPELQLALARCREALSLVQRVDKTLSGRE